MTEESFVVVVVVVVVVVLVLQRSIECSAVPCQPVATEDNWRASPDRYVVFIYCIATYGYIHKCMFVLRLWVCCSRVCVGGGGGDHFKNVSTLDINRFLIRSSCARLVRSNVRFSA